jgi:uncharacterized membrane protein
MVDRVMVEPESDGSAPSDCPAVPRRIWLLALAASLLLMGASGLRHLLFASASFDLGIFDQAAYLISQGLPPISSYMGYHILGDHAAWIWYPIGALYRLYPTVNWLFAIQAIALALGVVPLWQLARTAGLGASRSEQVAWVYLLYPLVLNANLFDFHPEVIAVPLLLWAIGLARRGRWGWYLASVIGVLGCKAVLSLTIVGLGLWLGLVEGKRRWGAGTIAIGLGWFWLASQWIVPQFSGKEAAAVGRYAYLGGSVREILLNLVLHPDLMLGHLFTGANAEYLLWLLLPIGWGLSRSGLPMLLGAVPCIALNLLADHVPQKSIVFHYSLPALPFLMVMVVETLRVWGRRGVGSMGVGGERVKGNWLRFLWGKGPPTRRVVWVWAIVGFVALAKWTYFTGPYLAKLDTWGASQGAIGRVEPGRSLLTTAELAPHVSHRVMVQHFNGASPQSTDRFDQVLLDTRHPGWQGTIESSRALVASLEQDSAFQVRYSRDGVYLFVRR